MKQHSLMLQYLIKHKTITGLESLTKLGIMSYTKVISDLRGMGVEIVSEWMVRESRFGKKRFVQYRLVKVPMKIKKIFL